jgi:hypothetical protein
MAKVDVFTFASVHHALRAEKIVAGEGISAKLIPVPRILSSCCHGLGLCVAPENGKQTADVLAQAGIPYEKHVVLAVKDL